MLYDKKTLITTHFIHKVLVVLFSIRSNKGLKPLVAPAFYHGNQFITGISGSDNLLKTLIDLKQHT